MSQKITGALWKELFRRSKKEGLSLQGQIRAMMVDAIHSGVLPPGEPVPSSRELADQLAVGRITVVLAYQQLAEEAFLISRQRKGHFVNPDFRRGQVSVVEPVSESPDAAKIDWSRRFCLQPNAHRSIAKPPDWQSYRFPFLYGQFDKELFPTAAWRECCMKALSVLDIREWAPDQITRDDESLIQQIQTKILPRRGVWASSDELMITVGAQHALYMVADLLMREGTTVAIEDPGYPDARNIFSCRTSQIIPLRVDEQGLPLSESLRSMDYVYTTPSHQCPTGVTMPRHRREALLRLAQESDMVIIEDDFESENSFDGDPIPALKSLDRNGRVIYIGSLSKSLAPGLRIGFIVAAPELIQELRALRRLMLRHPSTFIQRTLALFISLGHNDAQLRRLALAQKERHQVLLSALARYAPECQVVPVSGGGSCWIRLPEHIRAVELAERAAQRGVLIEPGDVFFISPKPPANYVRLGYQSIPASAIEQGIATLAEVMHGMG
jgi:GntR family transcriptional regulator / MocR family aminotransferase